MISTGVDGLDAMLGEGIPFGSRVLYSLDPGVDGQLFMISSLASSVKKGLSCLVILPGTTVDAFRNDAMARSVVIPGLENFQQVLFLDGIDRERIQKGAKTPEAQAGEWRARVAKICNENRVDVIFAYLDLLGEDFGLDHALAIIDTARRGPKTTVFLEHLNLEGTELIERFKKEFGFDLVVEVRSSDRPIPNFTYFTVAHCSWLEEDFPSVPFIIAEGGIVPYIPNIVVAGPENSGKTTFVANATERGRPPRRSGQEREPPSAIMDHGWLHWKDFDISLHGIPGKEQNDSLVVPALKHAMGAVLVIDATKPRTFARARHFITLIEKKKVPFIVAANKADLAERIDTATIRRALELPKAIPIYPIAATEPADVHKVLEALVNYITEYSR